MKKIIILVISIFLSSVLYSQVDTSNNKFPSYHIVKGDTIGVIFSIQQAQKIDNDEELLQLLGSMKTNCDSTISRYINVVNSYDNKLGILNMKISKLEDISNSKSDLILNLNQQISNYKEDYKKSEDQLSKKDDIILLQKKQINRLKWGKRIGYTSATIFLGLFVYNSIIRP